MAVVSEVVGNVVVGVVVSGVIVGGGVVVGIVNVVVGVIEVGVVVGVVPDSQAASISEVTNSPIRIKWGANLFFIPPTSLPLRLLL